MQRPRLASEVSAHGADVRALAEYRDGCLVSGSEDGTLRLLQPKAPCADVIGRHRDFVTGVCVTDSGVASASYDGTVRLWELPKL